METGVMDALPLPAYSSCIISTLLNLQTQSGVVFTLSVKKASRSAAKKVSRPNVVVTLSATHDCYRTEQFYFPSEVRPREAWHRIKR